MKLKQNFRMFVQITLSFKTMASAMRVNHSFLYIKMCPDDYQNTNRKHKQTNRNTCCSLKHELILEPHWILKTKMEIWTFFLNISCTLQDVLEQEFSSLVDEVKHVKQIRSSCLKLSRCKIIMSDLRIKRRVTYKQNDYSSNLGCC